MSLRCAKVSELTAEERDTLSIVVQNVRGFLGYGYVQGETPEPTAAQHHLLIEICRDRGRFLTEEEVGSVVGADGGDDGHH